MTTSAPSAAERIGDAVTAWQVTGLLAAAVLVLAGYDRIRDLITGRRGRG